MAMLMVFSDSADKIRAGIKTVTRRAGWHKLKVGTRLNAVDRSPHRGKSNRLATLTVVKVTSERLNEITQADVKREGFPDWTPERFVEEYCAANAAHPLEIVTRIEFEYVSVNNRQATLPFEEGA